MRSGAYTWARVLLTVILVSTACGKFLGWSAEFLLPMWAHYTMAALELGLAVGLWTRMVDRVLWAVLGVAACGLIAAAVVRSRDCGCLGNLLSLDWKMHLGLIAATGTAASVALAIRHRAWGMSSGAL